MNNLSMKEKTKILRALVEGCSIRSVERMTGHHRDTIMRLLVHTGLKAGEVMRGMIKDVPLNYLQADELWTFIGKKEKNLTYKERGYDDKTDKPFAEMSVLKNKLAERRFFFLRNTVYVIAHAKYFQIKNKAISPF